MISIHMFFLINTRPQHLIIDIRKRRSGFHFFKISKPCKSVLHAHWVHETHKSYYRFSHHYSKSYSFKISL